MLPWLKAVSAALALAAALGAQIRVNVNLVRVLATVKNPAGELVGALNKEDFEILDNGVSQQIAVFERQTEQPLSVAMMVDASGSTAKDLKYEVDSVGLQRVSGPAMWGRRFRLPNTTTSHQPGYPLGPASHGELCSPSP